MIEEEEISAMKRKARNADNIMRSGNGNYEEDDDDNQLMLDDDVYKPTPFKQKSSKMLDSDDEVPSSNKKLLMESDFERNEKKNRNIPMVKQNRQEDLFFMDKDADLNGSYQDDSSMASLETIDAFVGPVKAEFDQLKNLIDAKDKELEKLESDFYKRVSSKSMELEGIGPEQEAEIERHHHLYEMQKLMELNQRMSKIELEKIRLLKLEQKATARLSYRSKVIGERLAELESMHESESRKRELTLTKLYARLNGKIRQLIAYNEGNLKVI